jgi:Domain of unknown function (DUF4342)
LNEHTFWETVEAKGSEILDKVKELVAEGNVRRVRIRQKDHVIAEFPLTFGVVGALLAPVLAGIGAIAALATECTIEVERRQPSAPPQHEEPTAGVSSS